MRYGVRFALFLASGVTALAADVVTKAEPHALVIYHYAHTPAALLVAVSVFLLAVGLALACRPRDRRATWAARQLAAA